MSLPWERASNDVRSGDIWLKAEGYGPHSFWWGRDSDGRPALMMSLREDYSALVQQRLPRFRGPKPDFHRLAGAGGYGLIVSLDDPSAGDIFHRLCLSMMEAAQASEGESQAVRSVLNHLQRWHDFMSAAASRRLSEEEVRGLFAELVIMEHLIEHYPILRSSLPEFWRGPLDDAKDYRLEGLDIEVKATGGRNGPHVKISSAEQLDVEDSPLVLAVVELKTADDGDTGETLNAIIRRMRQRMVTSGETLFDKRLLSVGYAALEDYDQPQFRVGDIAFHEVSDGFPSITASALPDALREVRYELDTNMIAAYRVHGLDRWLSS